MTYRCPDIANSRTIPLIFCLPSIVCSNLALLVSVWDFSKYLIGSPGFGIYSLAIP